MNSRHAAKSPNQQNVDDQRNEWFGNILHSVSTDRDFLNLGIASEETQEFYDKIIFGNQNSIFSEIREKSTQYFISKLVVDYIQELRASNIEPLKIFLDHNDSQLLVWAEIKEDDEATEMGLYKAEAKANAKNYKHGFHISSTILENTDNIPVPPHYQEIQIP